MTPVDQLSPSELLAEFIGHRKFIEYDAHDRDRELYREIIRLLEIGHTQVHRYVPIGDIKPK